MKHFFHIGLAAALSLSTALPALAKEAHALLIGASTYVNLDESAWLNGPKNDVALVRDYLTSNPVLSFEPERVHVLADGLDGSEAPTLAAIRAQFAALSEAVEPGDFVYLHFSGHGTQAPAKDPASELDGLDELFLPVDIGPWNDTVGAVENGLVDDEIGQMIDAIRAKGAHVWVVFDSCHSGTATREAPAPDDNVRMRQLKPGALGVPDAAMAEAEGASRGAPGGEDPRARPEAAVEAGDGQAGEGKGSLVAFFAAQTNETTPEKNMPRGQVGRKPQGVFTYTLFETMAERPGITYRQLAQEVLRKYSVLNLARSTPLFEGDLDQPVFGEGGAGLILQWPAVAQGDMLKVGAGLLHGLTPGTELALLASPADTDEARLATYRVTEATTFSASAAPDGRAPEVPKGAVLRKMSAGIDFSLKVALPPAGSAPAAAMADAVTSMLREPAIAARVSFVPAGTEDADLRLAVIPQSPRPDAIWILPSTGFVEQDYARTPSVSTADKTAEELAIIMADTFATISKAQNLMKVGAAASAAQLPVEATLVTGRFDANSGEVIDGSRAPVAGGDVPRMVPDDVVGLTVRNNGDAPVDYNLLYVGADYSITFMGNGRMQPGATLDDDFVLISDTSFGRDRLIVILSPAAPQSSVEDLSFLEQSPLVMHRAAKDRARGFTGLLDEAGFGQTTRAAVSLSSRRKKAEPVPVFLQYEIDTLPRN